MRLVLLAALFCGFAAACAGSRAGVEEQARSIESEVWSPYCPGRLLIDCTTEQARELRAEIAHRLKQGRTRDEVIAWIRSNHGSEALARPDASGAGLIVWLVPAAIFAAGAVVVGSLIRRWSKAAATDL